jgi:hypothetical protein
VNLRRPSALLFAAVFTAAGLAAVRAAPEKKAAATAATNAPPAATGFTLPYKNKEGRLIARFSGADKQPLQPLSFTVFKIRDFKVETFNADGTPNLVGLAPECVLRIDNQSVSSTGPLTVTQAGGLFTLRGVGFEWNHESGRLVLSNKVTTVVRLNQFSPRR